MADDGKMARIVPPRDSLSRLGSRSLQRKAVRIGALICAAAILAGSGLVLRSEQIQSRNDLVTRFDLRAEIAARFLRSYVAETLERERSAAEASLASSLVRRRTFARVTSTLGFQAAVLLDSNGLLLRALPNDPSLVGTDLAARYEHLAQAEAGQVAVSNVVPSAVQGLPVVAFAVPFETSAGRRVLSGALVLSETTLGKAYLQNLSPLQNSTVWLVDSNGQTIASSSANTMPDLLERTDESLFTAVERGSAAGRYDGLFGPAIYAAQPIAGTSWRLVVAAPEAVLFLPIAGARTVVPWAVYCALVAAVGIGLLLQMRLARLKASQLGKATLLSLTDPMTGLHNRRGYELLAGQILRDAARERRHAAIMFFDMDGLKKINDELGHSVGNDAITSIAEILRATFRDSDVVARVGGDEFCVVGTLPSGSSDVTAQLGRLNEALMRFNESAPATFHLSLSTGVAIFDHEAPKSLATLEADADALMYVDKRGTTAVVA